EDELVLGLLSGAGGDDGRDADERRHLLRMIPHVEQAESPTPGGADEEGLAPAEAPSQVIYDGVEVGEMPRDRELARVGLRIERAPRSALVPVGHDEVILERAGEGGEQRGA